MRPALIRDCRGAAMVEGVILLPFFVIVFAGVYFIHQTFAARLGDMVTARGCAWQYSQDGCDPKNVPRGCQISEPRSAGLGLVDDGAEKSAFAQGVAEVSGAVGSVIETVLFLGDGFTASVRSRHRRPSVLGGATTPVVSRYTRMCNEKNRTPLSVVLGAYCTIGEKAGVELLGC